MKDWIRWVVVAVLIALAIMICTKVIVSQWIDWELRFFMDDNSLEAFKIIYNCSGI